MGKFVRSVSLLIVCAIAWAGAGVAGAGAASAGTGAPHAHSSSFVGTYRAYATLLDDPDFIRAPMTVSADGNASAGHQPYTWSNHGTTFTMTYSQDGTVQTFSGPQTTHGIASKKHPAVWTHNGTPYGVWYAIKTG